MLAKMVNEVPTIAISNRNICEGDFLEQVKKILNLNIKAFILREKDLDELQYFEMSEKVLKLCKEYNKVCVLHTFVDVAIDLKCSYVHLPIPILKESYSKNKLSDFEVIGSSVHSLEQALEAQKYGAKYITAGHIFETECKKGVKPRGIKFLKEICDNTNIPVYAIGGISYDKTESVIQAGAKGVCVMSGFMKMM